MPAKIRLQRKGKKRFAYYHIVIADSRAPRDGKSIEQLGIYNPNTNPATINIDFDRALTWVQNGAQPTDTCRAILSYKGILYKSHLLKGVKKGAMTMEQADAKFAEWMQSKESKINQKKERLLKQQNTERNKRLEDESKTRATIAEAIAKKNAEAALKAQEAAAAEETSENPETIENTENTEA